MARGPASQSHTPAVGPSRVSFIVPAYNEESRLGDSLARLIDFAGRQSYDAEIIVVDDGSSDRTAEIAREASSAATGSVSLRVLEHEQNRGKGAAVRTGVMAATGDYVMYLDADLATAPEETPKLLEALDSGVDVAAGSRIQADGVDMRASQPAWRRLGGRAFALVRGRLLLPDIQDSQCGFKAFRSSAAKALFSRQQLEGWAFDAELLYLAKQLGFSVHQVPIEWHHVEGSKFQLGVGSSLRELRDLARIRWLHRGVRPQS